MILRRAKVGQVTFVYAPNGGAKRVYLVGDFNGWDPTHKRMVKTRDGTYRGKVALEPGRYEYKFLVDGCWENDPEADSQAMNPYGSLNSVICVDENGG